MKHLIIFLLTLISFTASAQITNNTAWYKFSQKLTVGGRLQIPNDTLTLTAQDTGLIAIKNGQFFYSGVIGGSLQWSEITGGGGGSSAWGGITGTLSDQTDLQTALNAKANTSHTHAAVDIVSGIIATARLGSGTADNTTYLRGDGTWQTISSGGTWGSISGTLSSQTDLQSALDAKQATLVSGTNIKTINGNSLLGSGNLVISSTSGIDDVLAVGQVFSASRAIATSTHNLTISGTTNNSLLSLQNDGNAPVIGITKSTGSGAAIEITGSNTTNAFIVTKSNAGSAIAANSSYGFSSVIEAISTAGTATASLYAEKNTTTTNAVMPTLELRTSTTGTPAVGLGSYIINSVEANGGYAQSRIGHVLTNVGASVNQTAFFADAHFNGSRYDVLRLSPAVLQTTNNTPTTIYTISVTDETTGVLEVTLFAKSNATSGGVTGKKIVAYRKDGGTLTLGSITDVLPTVANGDLTTATWTITTSSNNIIVQATGETSRTIDWTCVANFLSR